MKTQKKIIKKPKELVSLLLAFSLIILSGELDAKARKHGAKLIVQKKNGEQIKGELIAVKENALLLLTDTLKLDLSLSLEDIKFVKILNKSKVAQEGGIGLLCGAGVGALLGSSSTSPGSG